MRSDDPPLVVGIGRRFRSVVPKSVYRLLRDAYLMARGLPRKFVRCFPRISKRLITLRKPLTDPVNRYLRAEMLEDEIDRLRSLLQECQLDLSVTVSPDGSVFVDIDDVSLNVTSNLGYCLKRTRGSEGEVKGFEYVFEFLGQREADPQVIVDVGAYIGELSLEAARRWPHARIVAVEASPETALVLQENVRRQRFSTKNIEVVNVAVAASPGWVSVSRGRGTENFVSVSLTEADSSRVRAETLKSLVESRGFSRIDLLKIDVEGGEPDLVDDLKAISLIVKVMLIEVSEFQPVEKYCDLVSGLMGSGFACEAMDGRKFATREEFGDYMRSQLSLGHRAFNVWFYKSP
jgi:FkbM family methyltransferase